MPASPSLDSRHRRSQPRALLGRAIAIGLGTSLSIGVLAVSLSSCKTASPGAAGESAVLADSDAATPLEAFTPINRRVGHGDFVEVPVDPTREIVQVTCKFDASYSVYDRDASGEIRKNDEGQPFYKDGMYAVGYIVDESGKKREIAPKKFIDADETDNWHDLYQVKGTKLRIEFRHAPQYESDPEVQAAAQRIEMRSVRVRYADDPNATYDEFVYNNVDDSDELSEAAKVVPDGTSHKVVVPAARQIYRVDVRWGDAKPRENGVYIPGRANGSLFVDGIEQGSDRNVAAIETQVWTPIRLGSGQHDHVIEVRFYGDNGRIHWIRAYYQP